MVYYMMLKEKLVYLFDLFIYLSVYLFMLEVLFPLFWGVGIWGLEFI